MGGALRTCVQVLVGVNSFYPDFRTSYVATYIWNTYQHTYVQTSVHTYTHTCQQEWREMRAYILYIQVYN